MSEHHKADDTVYPVFPEVAKNAWIDADTYERLYRYSIEHPKDFWGEQATRVSWFRPFTKVKSTSFKRDDVSIKWFKNGELNVSYNCLDRHLADRAEQTAIIWEGDDPANDEHITYRDLYHRVCRFANAMREHGVKKGDIVTLYMPMVPEAAVAMLACTRLGAVHSVVFGGFSPEAIANRIDDCHSRFVVTADEAVRGGKKIPLKHNVDEAISLCKNATVEKVFVVKKTDAEINWVEDRDLWYADIVEGMPMHCFPELMNAEDPLFILYTSGSTGKPKGVLHTTGGYLVYATTTFKYVFDYHSGDVFWCTADVGWITGHTYTVYGPLANGGITVMMESVPNYPDSSRIGKIIDKHQINILYTAPTAIRALMKDGDAPIHESSRKSLKLLGSVGEPINPEAWEWYFKTVGDSRCPIVDTWWQTETGGILITPLPGATALKPGSATRPFFGIQPAIVDDDGHHLEGECEGNLVILDSWPGQMRSLYGDHERFMQTYFSTFDNVYTTGDGARRDKDGYYWITGRVDDVLNISGHRMGTAEIESAMVLHNAVAEAAVVGYLHDIKGQGIYVYVTLNAGITPSDDLKKELINQVRREIGPIASPDLIQWAPSLPKTRSGKIMRRILRKIACNDFDNLGDTSTLAEPEVVQDLIDNRCNRD